MSRRVFIAFVSFVAIAGGGAATCSDQLMETGRASITGVVAQSGLSPSETAFLFLADNPLDATVAAPDGRFNLFTLERGETTLVAADAAGFSGSVGLVLDGNTENVGVLALAPCSANVPQGEASSCPDSPLSTTPPAPQAVPSFRPDTTDVALSEYPSPTVNIHAVSIGQNLAVNIMLPAESQFFGPGTHHLGLDVSFDDPASVLLFRVDGDDLFVYRLLEGTLHVKKFNPTPGGTVSLTLENAVFAWYDPITGFVDSGATVVIDETGTTMAGQVIGTADPGGAFDQSGDATPTPFDPGGAISTVDIYDAFAHSNADGNTYVFAAGFDENGNDVLFDIEIFGNTTLQNLSVNNKLDGPPEQWTQDLQCRVTWLVDGWPADYYLVTATVNGTLAPVGQTMSLQITNATYYYSPDYSSVDPSYPLTIDNVSITAPVEPPPY